MMPMPNAILTIATLLAMIGMWLMLPRGTERGRYLGILLAVVSLGLCLSQLPRLGDWLMDGLFWIFAAVTIVSAVAAVTFRNPVYCALWFGQSIFGAAALFLLVGAQFLAVALVVVYAGAILVTFLFVLMLAQPEGRAQYDRMSWESLLSAATGIATIGLLSIILGRAFSGPMTPPTEQSLATDILTSQHVARIGAELFGRHLPAVDIAGVLLFAALVGAAAIAPGLKKFGVCDATKDQRTSAKDVRG